MADDVDQALFRRMVDDIALRRAQHELIDADISVCHIGNILREGRDKYLRSKLLHSRL